MQADKYEHLKEKYVELFNEFLNEGMSHWDAAKLAYEELELDDTNLEI